MISWSITIVVISIGLLGLAVMQATGLRNNNNAYFRSQATVLAYDIADRMRANTSSINNYLTSFMTLAAATDQAGCTTTGSCSAAQMAQDDLFDWNVALGTALPSPTGVITIAGGLYTINVVWDVNRDGVTDGADDNVQVSFQP